MALIFLDSSALVKRYVTEIGSNWVTTLTEPVSGNLCWINEITPVEILASFYRRVRAGTLTFAEAQQAERTFLSEQGTHYQPISFSSLIIARCLRLVSVHALRAYDAIQLAGALQLRSQRMAFGASAVVTLVSADQELNRAAAAEGLLIDDPNLHP